MKCCKPKKLTQAQAGVSQVLLGVSHIDIQHIKSGTVTRYQIVSTNYLIKWIWDDPRSRAYRNVIFRPDIQGLRGYLPGGGQGPTHPLYGRCGV